MIILRDDRTRRLVFVCPEVGSDEERLPRIRRADNVDVMTLTAFVDLLGEGRVFAQRIQRSENDVFFVDLELSHPETMGDIFLEDLVIRVFG